MALPAQNDITNAATVAAVQTEFEDQRDFVSTMLGGGPRTEITIASGTVTPGARDHGGIFTVDTESDAASDDLDTITSTNVSDGQLIMLMAETESRVVTLKNNNGGSGEMLFSDSADYVLDQLEKWVLFRRDSAAFVEIARYTLPVADPTIQTFTTNGTWTKPANLKYAIIEVQAGGGAGGGAASTSASQSSAGAGGGGGGYSRELLLDAALGATETVTVGAGGTGVSGAAGNSGGTSSFGTLLSATGGSGGSRLTATTGGTANNGAGGGGSSGGDLNAKGGAGEGANVNTHATAFGKGGAGGASVLGGGAIGTVAQASPANGVAGGAYGGGGGGAANGQGDAARAGGAGGDGVVIVTEYYG